MNFKHLHKPLLAAATLLLASCAMEPADNSTDTTPTASDDRLLVLCEGIWGMDNSSISLIDGGTVTNNWFQAQNPGQHLGDTGNDILQVNDTLIAISVNSSNIIQYIRPNGKAITATENIPNNRKLATDGTDYLYVTSYANDGYVAKVDLRTKQVVDTCKTGYEPEGITYYKGLLYVANSGGYAYTGTHDYESTVSVIDAQTMKELRRIDTGCKNLYGNFSRSGQFVCINSAGNYADISPKTVVLNLANEEFEVFDFASTYNCAYNGKFYVLGSAYSSATNAYAYSTHTISLPDLTVTEGLGTYSAAQSAIEKMENPYGLYISPTTGHLYVSDARSYTSNGYVYEFSTNGTQLNRWLLEGLNPAHFLVINK